MKDLAPTVFRRRLLIEATYTRSLRQTDVARFLRDLPDELGLRIYADPVVYSPAGQGREVNQGYDGFVALVDSGIAAYVWENVKFASVLVYSCKPFDEEKAIAFTRRFFEATQVEQMTF